MTTKDISIKLTPKKSIRRKLLSMRSTVCREEILKRSLLIEKQLISLPKYQQAHRIMFYVSLPGEVDTHKMISNALSSGKQVIVPITNKQANNLLISQIHHFPKELEPSTYGVMEPQPHFYRLVPPSHVDLMIMPGVAFDRSGYRLGHGKGYYDRFLKTFHTPILRIALAFDFQILDKVPTDEWDVPVHIIITESRIIQCRKLP